MALFPVIMCGGAGTRLWPASTPARPKPFLDLIGDHSLFAATVQRVAPLAAGGGELIVVAGEQHQAPVLEDLTRLGVAARLLLEPEPRDSGPAMTAAASQALALDPDAVIAVVASDHHIPDGDAFRAAVARAAQAAQDGRIVTLGMTPTWPSPAFGYIAPESGTGLRPVAAFVEKPSAETAADYIARGYLWNSGNFIARADVLADEIARFEPDMRGQVQIAVAEARRSGEGWLLADAFRTAPKVSIDYAVMEKTDRASVLPVDFAWSDVGSWDAVIDGGASDQGEVMRLDAEGGLARIGEGLSVAILGVPDLIVVAEGGQVLITRAGAAGRIREAAQRFPPRSEAAPDFETRAHALADWMRLRALPVWTSLGRSEDGLFHETLTAGGRASTPLRRARVQPRQAYSLSIAGKLGWTGAWRAIADKAMARFEADHGLPGGGYATRLNPDGSVLDGAPLIYDLAFVLLARAGLGDVAATAPLLAFLDAGAHPAGGYAEGDHRPFQSNALMHLFEAFLAWEVVRPDAGWEARADSLARLALDRLIDVDGGFIREVYDTDWNPAAGDEGRIVEPGHQFEWAGLLQTWAGRRGDAEGTTAARRLFDAGRQGIDPARGVAIDEMDANLTPTRRTARLWPQTERLKSALILADAINGERGSFRAEAAAALAAIQTYLTPDGLWADVMDEQGTVQPGPAPASTLYHLMTAVDLLAAFSKADDAFSEPLSLA